MTEQTQNKKKPLPGLSVVIITLNEALRIGDCLSSVSFADEIIVADSGSTDDTCKISQELGARVEKIAFTGFGTTKQSAIEFARHEWILSLDADEIVGNTLQEEIKKVLKEPPQANGYIIQRDAWFLGKRIRYGGWDNTRILRLFRNGKGRFTDDQVHERIIVEGHLGSLNGILEHHTVTTFPHYLAKLDRYSTLGAQKIVSRSDNNIGIGSAFYHAIAKFLSMYVLKAGWRDGLPGALLAVSSAYSTFLRYTKAAMMLRGVTKPFLSSSLEERHIDRRDKGSEMNPE
ncbi:MAG: glycosyltransferase family 2 protein [Candidatus Electryonea clarkiae]|nr:glycosyltransferase family 2 protein [Candidatus Electryonea clarkiae]MDP8285371.1 glycosyltransferase family 2 protein [Candidatus Electryonea clarkiae]